MGAFTTADQPTPSQTGLIEDHDDDVMDEQSECSLLDSATAVLIHGLPSPEWSTCTWLLFVELAKRQATLEAAQSDLPRTPLPESKAREEMDAEAVAEAVTDPSQDIEQDVRGMDVPNPHLTWGEARQVMTRPDYINELDHLNIIHIDRHHHIRADSMPLLRAFRLVAESDGYEDKLERVMDRVSAIESLNRTREVRMHHWCRCGAMLTSTPLSH